MRAAPSLLCLVLLAGCGARTGLGEPEPFDAASPSLDAALDAGIDAPPPIDAGPPPIDAPECAGDGDCDDGVACTVDLCVTGRCVTEPDHLACDDGLFCTGPERCDVVRGCVSSPPRCADSVSCTVDRCDEALDACVSEPDPDLCPISHRCDPIRGCIARALAHDETRLYEIDLPSGVLHALGETPVVLTDLALHPDGTLYGAVGGRLVRVDYEAGTVADVVDVPGAFVGLDVSPEGEMFGSVDDRIVRFDLERGRTSIVARFPAGLVASGDVAFVEGRLYATVRGGRGGDWLVEVSLAPGGRARIIGATGHECIWGLAPFGDRLYGLTCEGRLVLVDTRTGAATTLASPGARFYGAGAR